MENLWPYLKRRSKAQTIVGIWIIRRFKKNLKRFAWGDEEEVEVCETSECDRDQRASREDII